MVVFERSHKNLLDFLPEKCKLMNFNCSHSSLVLDKNQIFRKILWIRGVTADRRWSTHFMLKLAKCNKTFNFWKGNLQFHVFLQFDIIDGF